MLTLMVFVSVIVPNLKKQRPIPAKANLVNEVPAQRRCKIKKEPDR